MESINFSNFGIPTDLMKPWCLPWWKLFRDPIFFWVFFEKIEGIFSSYLWIQTNWESYIYNPFPAGLVNVFITFYPLVYTFILQYVTFQILQAQLNILSNCWTYKSPIMHLLFCGVLVHTRASKNIRDFQSWRLLGAVSWYCPFKYRLIYLHTEMWNAP